MAELVLLWGSCDPVNCIRLKTMSAICWMVWSCAMCFEDFHPGTILLSYMRMVILVLSDGIRKGLSVRGERPMEKDHVLLCWVRKPRLGTFIRDGIYTVTLQLCCSQGMGVGVGSEDS